MAIAHGAVMVAAHSLGRLNDAERQVLSLLARGHTVKSAAGQLGWTDAAVNERLRSARSKTGIGSSRELARHYAQKVGDDFSGLETPGRLTLGDGASLDRRGLAIRKALPVMTIVLLAVAGFQLATQPQPRSSDPLIGVALDMPDPARPVHDTRRVPAARTLHTLATAERRNEAFAKRREAQLAELYRPLLQRVDGSLRITCSDTMCEVIAATKAKPSEAAAETLLEQAHSRALTGQIGALGFIEAHAILGDNGRDRKIYLGYWRPAAVR